MSNLQELQREIEEHSASWGEAIIIGDHRTANKENSAVTKITKKLKKAGYTKVFNLYGGIVEWVNQGLPVYDPQGNSTNKVHTYTKFWGKWLDKGVRVY